VWEFIILVMLPPTCKAYPVAILLHDYCAIYESPSTPVLNAIHHTILAMPISCKGQAGSHTPSTASESFFRRKSVFLSGLTRISRPSMCQHIQIDRFVRLRFCARFAGVRNRWYDAVWPIQDMVLFMRFCARINTIRCAPTL